MASVKGRFLRFAFSSRNPFYAFFAAPDKERPFPAFGENYPVFYEGRSLPGFLLRGKGGLIVVIHGGGYLFGHYLDEADYSRYLHEKTGMSVLSCHYDLSEQAQFPTQPEQVYAAVKAVCQDASIDSGKLFLAGHSAGANCAAAIALLANRRKAFTVDGVILNYPVLDFSCDPGKRPKIKGNSIPPMMMEAFNLFYFSDSEDAKDPLASPLLAGDEELCCFPPTYILTCGQDSLRIDGLRFVDRLRQLNRDVTRVEYPQRHGFIEAGMKSDSKEEIANIAKAATDEMLTWLKLICNGG